MRSITAEQWLLRSFGTEPRIVAARQLLTEFGVKHFDYGITTTAEGQFVVWATGTWPNGEAEVGAGMDALTAVLRLCGEVIDGEACPHCDSPMLFTEDLNGVDLLESAGACVYAWDPELLTFRRSCEGEHA